MKIRSLLLSLGIAAVFALTCVPGAVEYHTCAGGIIATHYYALFSSGEICAFLSGILTGVSLLLALRHLFRGDENRPTACGVLLVLAVFSSLFGWFSHSSITLLNIAIMIGQSAAALFVFLMWETPRENLHSAAEIKHGVWLLLALAALNVVMQIPCRSINLLFDMEVTKIDYTINSSLPKGFSLFLTYISLEIMVLYLLGAVRKYEKSVGIMLLLSAALMIFVEPLQYDSLHQLLFHITPIMILATVVQALLGLSLLRKHFRKKIVPEDTTFSPS